MTNPTLPLPALAVLPPIVALLIPLLSPLLRSPIALLLLSPFLFVAFALLALLLVIAIAQTLDARSSASQRSHLALKHATRTLSFATPAAWSVVLTRSSWAPASVSLPALLPSQPAFSSQIDALLDLLLSAFVLPWYTLLSKSPTFPAAIKKNVHHVLSVVLSRGLATDPLAVAAQRILPKLTAHIDRFRAAETLLRGADLSRHLTQSSSLDLMLAQKYGLLHPAVSNLSSLDTRQTEEQHLRGMVDRVLGKVLPKSEARSTGVTIIVREIVACVVLLPLVDMLSDPDFWNRIVEDVTSEVIQQQHLISRVRHILSLSTSPPGASGSLTSPTDQALQPVRLRMEDISPRTSGKQFEGFLRSIARCDSLLDARRLKSDIASEIRKTRLLLATNHGKDDLLGGYKPELIVKYLDRLYTASRAIEKRIGVLSGAPTLPTIPASTLAPAPSPARRNGPIPTLRTILTTPESLSYFMEFLDRRGKSLSVQFWLTVESFKDPLETVDSDGEDDVEEVDDAAPAPNGVTLKEDIQLIWDLYFSEASVQRPRVSQRHIDAMRTLLDKDGPPTRGEERRVRRAVLLMQREMEGEMEGGFEEFKRGELWLKAIAAGNSAPDLLPPRTANDPGFQDILSPVEESKRKRPLPQYITPTASSMSVAKVNAPRGRVETDLKRPASVRTHSDDSRGSSTHRPRPSLDSARSNLDVLIGAGPRDRLPLFGDDADESSRERVSLFARDSSVDDIQGRAPLSGRDQAEEGRAPLFGNGPEERWEADAVAGVPEGGVDIEAIQAALTDIIADEAGEGHGDEHDDDDRVNGLGFDAEPSPAIREREEEEWKLAIPGDPHLLSSIARLGEKIASLEHQSSILDALTRKAELTGDTNELKLLSKSKAAMDRELREVRFQREQFVMQERNGMLTPERTRIMIVGTALADEEGSVGRQVVKYAIQVQQLDGQDGEGEGTGSGWVTARRYSEFWALQQRLREKFPEVRNLELPAKKLVSTTSAVVDARRVALEKYLQTLLTFPTVCASEDLRAFLSRSSKYTPTSSSATPFSSRTSSFLSPPADFMRSLTRLTSSIADDIFFGPSMLDVLIQRLTQQAKSEEELGRLTEAEGLRPLEGESGGAGFAGPICDLILAVFELNERNNWLRRQAVVIILQQVLGSTIERKLRETLKSALEEQKLIGYVEKAKDMAFPAGRLKPPSLPRTSDQKSRTRDEANRKLSALMPDLFSNMIGRSNARRGARRLFAVLQNQRLNRHIIYTVMDEVFFALFPELANEE